jgi:hypothetical protein
VHTRSTNYKVCEEEWVLCLSASCWQATSNHWVPWPTEASSDLCFDSGWPPCVHIFLQISPFYKNTSYTGLGPILTDFILTWQQTLSANKIILWGIWAYTFKTWNWGGNTIYPVKACSFRRASKSGHTQSLKLCWHFKSKRTLIPGWHSSSPQAVSSNSCFCSTNLFSPWVRLPDRTPS